MIKMNIDELTINEIEKYYVWKYVNNDSDGELLVSPVIRLPVKNLNGKIVACSVRLANGCHANALIGNIDLENPKLTQHFLSISFLNDGKWFALARYHDFDYESRGPSGLASFFNLSTSEIFPITYDVSNVVKDFSESLRGEITEHPKEKLTRAEIIALAVP